VSGDPSLRRRAAMHAALGEPVRLAIAEHLALGDASPGELGTEFDLPTNLLAHHLRVLETAGIVRRVQSEGDRRRSYVQLVHGDALVARLVDPVTGAPGGVRSAGPIAAVRVLFVCTRNSARSQLAAAAWARVSRIPVASAGTDPAAGVHPRAVVTARRHGLSVRRMRPRHLRDVARQDDLIVAVCDRAYEAMPPPLRRLHWAVPDPAALDSDAAFETAYQQIAGRVDRLARAVIAGPAG
jgi:protein-tyrosine-phosphatase/DNA-binding HxlR family transcriptional regulator